MTELEKVIDRLETAVMQMHGSGRYTPEDVDEWEMAGWDSLALLKAQMPRVMTWDEVCEFSKISDYEFSEKTPCYMEFKSPDPCYVKWIDAEKMFQWLSVSPVSLERRRRCYNNDVRFGWRCWTSRPSPEQMASTPWLGEKDD